MTIAGWIFMSTSLVFVVSLMSACIYKMMTLPPREVEESMHAPGIIDTGDTEDAD